MAGTPHIFDLYRRFYPKVSDLLDALTDPNKTDFFVEYLGIDGRWHRYSPDFVIRRKDGRCTIVEVKAERERDHPVDGERGRKAMAVRRWADLNPELLQYKMVLTSGETTSFNRVQEIREVIYEA